MTGADRESFRQGFRQGLPFGAVGFVMPRPFMRVLSFAAPPLLTALVVTSVLADGRRLAVGADTAGVLVGTVLLELRVPLMVAAATAVLVTATLRAVV